jgi:hypothetical protein
MNEVSNIKTIIIHVQTTKTTINMYKYNLCLICSFGFLVFMLGPPITVIYVQNHYNKTFNLNFLHLKGLEGEKKGETKGAAILKTLGGEVL